MLAAYSWPGNVRELENFMERLSILADDDVVPPADLPRKILDEVGDIVSLPEPTPPDPLPVASGAASCGMPAGFSWPTITDLRDKGMNLKDFLDTVEERLLDEALGMAEGVKNQAAEILGIKRTTLIEKLKKKRTDS